MAKWIKVNELIIREAISSRGGGVEIDLTRKGFKGQKMTAYQNYLGGGMLGAIGNDCTKRDRESVPKLVKIAKELREYMHNVTNPDNELEMFGLNDVQKRPLSAY